jgi:hypothetical protein
LKPLRVGVALTGLAAQEAHQVDLFEKPRNAKLVRAIDLVNEKFGKGALFYGDAAPRQSSKIAFQRYQRSRSFEHYRLVGRQSTQTPTRGLRRPGSSSK